jgi:hypothetical protein
MAGGRKTMRLSILTFSAVMAFPLFAAPETPKMGADAFNSVNFIARVMSGHAVIRSGFEPDGRVFRFITSGYAPLRGETDAQRKARIAEISDEKWQTWLDRFAELADTDGSGVVDTREGKALKDAVYYGLTAAQLSEVKTFERFEELMDDDEDVVAAALERYPSVQEAAEREAIGALPRLPDQFRRPNPAP